MSNWQYTQLFRKIFVLPILIVLVMTFLILQKMKWFKDWVIYIIVLSCQWAMSV